MSVYEGFIRLAFAMIIGGLIGLEREFNDRPAGLRTHILVCVGSALIMMISLDVSTRFIGIVHSDPARIAAQVVSGIGFLGAGTILREGANVRGLTTAASLWITAGLGLAAGSGLYLYGGFAMALTLVTLTILNRIEPYAALQRSWGSGVIRALDEPGVLGRIGGVFGAHGINISGLQMTSDHEEMVLEMDLKFPKRLSIADVVEEIERLEPVISVKIEKEHPER